MILKAYKPLSVRLQGPIQPLGHPALCPGAPLYGVEHENFLSLTASTSKMLF